MEEGGVDALDYLLVEAVLCAAGVVAFGLGRDDGVVDGQAKQHA
jgi:hypothetical protein